MQFGDNQQTGTMAHQILVGIISYILMAIQLSMEPLTIVFICRALGAIL